MNRINKVSRRAVISALAAGAAAPAYGQILPKDKKKAYAAPGVYVEEIPSGARTIAHAQTSVALFIDVFGGGPLETVTGLASFQSLFGTRPGASETAIDAVALYFRNGGAKALIASVPDGSAASLSGGPGAGGVRDLLDAPALNIDFVCIPPAAALPVSEAAQVYAEALSFAASQKAMLFLDAPVTPGFDAKDFVSGWLRGLGVDHPNAALYAPRLTASGSAMTLPASAAAAGVAARIDREAGIWKAPAGTRAMIAGAAPAASLSARDIEILTEANVNAIRPDATRGPLVWGARTLSGNPEWKYAPVRRTALFIEKSLDAGLEWTVFEPNDEPLWAEIRRAAETFLYGLFRQGAFAGAKADQAYFVRCDRTTTTQADIQQGVCNLQIGFAPLKPAEFILLRLALRAAA